MTDIDAQKFGELLGRFESLCERCERCQEEAARSRLAAERVATALAEHIAWHKATDQAELARAANAHWSAQLRLLALSVATGGISAALVTFGLNLVFRR